MEIKKKESLDLDRKRPLFFNIGLVTAIGLTIGAFNWKSQYEIEILPTPNEVFDEVYRVPVTKFPEPEPPKVKSLTPKANSNQQLAVLVSATDLPTDILDAFPIDQNVDFVPDFTGDFEPIIDEIPDEEFIIVENMPEFPGGNKAFYKYVSENINYPSQARRMGIEGKVYLQFVVDKDGSVTDVKVVKGIGAGCDEEAAEVLSNAPKWIPGKQRGREVKVRMILPISFSLSN